MANQYKNGHGSSSKSSPDPTYTSWTSMKTRCGNPQHKSYCRYGGRGISVCERWNSFDNFLADMGSRPLGTTLDRIDTDGHYEPGNCRWATRKQQMDNQRKTVFVECFGLRLTLADWSLRTGVSKESLRRRLLRGVAPEVALASPPVRGKSLPAAMARENTHG